MTISHCRTVLNSQKLFFKYCDLTEFRVYWTEWLQFSQHLENHLEFNIYLNKGTDQYCLSPIVYHTWTVTKNTSFSVSKDGLFLAITDSFLLPKFMVTKGWDEILLTAFNSRLSNWRIAKKLPILNFTDSPRTS